MMNNDFNESNPQEEVNRLKEENQFLKEEVRRLNTKVAGLNSVNSVPVESPLVEYYLNRYAEIHNFVLNNRLQTLDDELAECEKAYSELTSKEDRLEEIAKNNETINSRLNAINEKITQNDEKLKNATSAFEEEANAVTDLENNIYYANLDYYNNLLNKLSIGNMEDTIEYMNFVSDVLKYTLYNEVIRYLNDAKKALGHLEALNTLEYEVKNENVSLENERKTLTDQIETISFEETEKQLDDLIYEITTKKNTKEELSNLFSDLKKQNEKEIKDEIKHFQILEYTNQQVALKLDEMILDYKKRLLTVDTASNEIASRKIKLTKLNDKLAKILPYKKLYDEQNNEYNELQGMYQTINKNIEEIENYITEAKKILDANQIFTKTIKDYSDAKFKLEAVKTTLDTILIREKNLAETRKQILNNPYGKTDLIKLDDELRIVQDDIDNYTTEERRLENIIYTLKQNEQGYKIISVYEDYLLCENKLPILYDKQKSLSTLINDKYLEVSSAKAKCSDYDSLQEQIEELENEIASF